MLYGTLLAATALVAGGIFLAQPVLGQAFPNDRRERIRQSPHFKDGQFQNLEYTPAFAEGYSPWKVIYKFLFRKNPNNIPAQPIPGIQTNLKSLPPDGNRLVWFGHSSYYLQIAGVKMLIDPVFSNYASPVPGFTKAFAGANRYTAADFPEIDYLFITHDHYDHLDKATVKALRPKVKKVVCGLGVGVHLEGWGYAPEQLIETDWNETHSLQNGVTLHTLPTRHFSGRGLKRNGTLWMSYLLETPAGKIFLGGDGGYGKHFARIGAQHGPIDFAILENGQYNPAWHNIHCLPEETLQAARDLGAKQLMPVHNSKFALAPHAWNEPMQELTRLNSGNPIPLVRPKIGEVVELFGGDKDWPQWWLE